jgi:hypothetical protein
MYSGPPTNPRSTTWNQYGGDQNLTPFSAPNKPVETNISGKKAIYDTGKYSTDKVPDLLSWLSKGHLLFNIAPFGGSYTIASPSGTSVINDLRGSILDTRYTNKTFDPSKESIITNPYGARATIQNVPYINGIPNVNQTGNAFNLNLLPGQSIDVSTGRLDNPNLHASTAQRLNDQLNARRANEAGTERASATTTRGMTSVLSTLDEQYIGSFQSKKPTTKLTGLAQANQIGVNASPTKTILGNK